MTCLTARCRDGSAVLPDPGSSPTDRLPGCASPLLDHRHAGTIRRTQPSQRAQPVHHSRRLQRPQQRESRYIFRTFLKTLVPFVLLES